MILYCAFALTLLTAAGHSYLSEKLFLRPMRRQSVTNEVFQNERARKLTTLMYHFPSLCWAAMGLCLLLLHPGTGGYREVLTLFAIVFALSGVGNFWAVGKPHAGGVMLLVTSGLVIASLSA